MTRAQDYRRRRQALAQLYPQPVWLYSGSPTLRNAAQPFAFRACSHFLYFCGWNQPEVWVRLEGGEATLYWNRPGVHTAVWEGPGPRWEELQERFGFDHLQPAVERPPLAMKESPAELQDAVIQLRLSHDEAAQRQLREAVDMSVRAHFQAMRATRPERREFQIVATLLVSVTQEGGGCSFQPIVSTAGEVLHNPHYQGTLERGQLLLVDFGAETGEGWAGDLTRTYPVRTTFSPRQAEIYQVVLKAEKAAIEACRPGVEYRQVHRVACLEIAAGLVDLGLLKGQPEDLVERGAHALFFPHGIGHLLGLDVHDMEDLGDRAGYAPGRSRSKQFGTCYLRLDRCLQPQMAVTIEPGFYWIPQLLENPEYTDPLRDCLNPETIAAYREVRGIRIEDDVLITAEGRENLSQGLPKELQELEIVVNS